MYKYLNAVPDLLQFHESTFMHHCFYNHNVIMSMFFNTINLETRLP